jgi:hypothetical protein
LQKWNRIDETSTAEAVERAEKTLDRIYRIEAKTLKFITCHAGQE